MTTTSKTKSRKRGRLPGKTVKPTLQSGASIITHIQSNLSVDVAKKVAKIAKDSVVEPIRVGGPFSSVPALVDIRLTQKGDDKGPSGNKLQFDFSTETRRFPATWWDAFKERWFPQWLLDDSLIEPIRYTTYEVQIRSKTTTNPESLKLLKQSDASDDEPYMGPCTTA